MKRRLLLLDLTLLVLVIACGSLLRERYLKARLREQTLLRQIIPPIPAPPVTPLPAVVATKAIAYEDVAQKLLFSRDRNPNVILDPVIPPAPKPMPPLPRAHGVMSFGGTPTVILSEAPGRPHHGYRPGDQVGAFTLVAVNNTDILFEWEGLRVLRKLEEITDKEAAIVTAAAAPAPSTAAPQPTTTVVSRPADAGPGADIGADMKACVAGDSSPPGTVAAGYRKVVSQTPMGASCRWEAVR